MSFRNKLNLFAVYFRYYIFPALLTLGAIVGAIYFGNSYLDNLPTPTQVAVGSQTFTPQPSLTLTQSFVSTEIFTPISTPTEIFTPTVTSLPTEITDAKGAKMVLVPAGKFIMGSDNGKADEKPSDLVDIATFYIDKYEITNRQFTLFLNDIATEISVTGGEKVYFHGHFMYYLHIPPRWEDPSFNRQDKISWNGGVKYTLIQKYEDQPVEYVTWFGAKEYCEWRDARLPTEAEWEKAARGSDGRTYPWGEEIDKTFANYMSGDIRQDKTTAIGSYESGKVLMAHMIWLVILLNG